jgi:hypothetical protein
MAHPDAGASSISVTGMQYAYHLPLQNLIPRSSSSAIHNSRSSTNVRPPPINTLSQMLTTGSTKCEDGTLFLGDGSLAGVPTPKLGGKGIRPVIKVVDDKCL